MVSDGAQSHRGRRDGSFFSWCRSKSDVVENDAVHNGSQSHQHHQGDDVVTPQRVTAFGLVQDEPKVGTDLPWVMRLRSERIVS